MLNPLRLGMRNDFCHTRPTCGLLGVFQYPLYENGLHGIADWRSGQMQVALPDDEGRNIKAAVNCERLKPRRSRPVTFNVGRGLDLLWTVFLRCPRNSQGIRLPRIYEGPARLTPWLLSSDQNKNGTTLSALVISNWKSGGTSFSGSTATRKS